MNTALFPPIPVDTSKAARAIFGRSNLYLMIGDQASELFAGLFLEDLPGWDQKPARTLARLYLITIFQYVETLPDHLAADAWRERVDWKYALHVPLDHPGMEADSFCQFRRRLLSSQTSKQNLQTLLERLSTITESCKLRIFLESGQVITDVCTFSRLAKVTTAISQVMEVLAITRPDWLRANSLPHWYTRYGKLGSRVGQEMEREEQERSALLIGADGFYLLDTIASSEAPELAILPEVQTLAQVWQEQYERVGEKPVWRGGCLNCFLSARQTTLVNW